MDWHEVGYSFRHNFPSYRLRHAIRMRRYRRASLGHFAPDVAPLQERDEDGIVGLPPSDVFDRDEP